MPEASAGSPVQTRRFRIGAVIVIALIVGLLVWLTLRNTGSSSSKTNATKTNATAVSVAQIKTFAASVHHPVFWTGAKQGNTYELTRTSNGTISIRYLPPGVKVGAKQPYLTVVTYPFVGAFQAIRGVINQRDSTPINVPGDGIAVASKRYPASIHVAYPGIDYQVEVFDPEPAVVRRIVTSGRVKAIG
jgi:hypothetical protein